MYTIHIYDIYSFITIKTITFQDRVSVVMASVIIMHQTVMCSVINYNMTLHGSISLAYNIHFNHQTVSCGINNNNGNLYSAGIRHVVALMALLHNLHVHQTHIKHHANTILLMLSNILD